MNLNRLVCPYDQSLISRFRGRDIVVRVDSPGLVCEAADAVTAAGNRLICVILNVADELASVPLDEDWKRIPILLMTPAVGAIRKVVPRLSLLRSLNLRVALPATADNIRDVRILSSVGVHGAIMLEGSDPLWEPLSDLMVYALCGRVPHASIEPFDYISRRYEPGRHLKWEGVLFDDVERYFHLDREGNVAMSSCEALANEFIGHIDVIEEVGSPDIDRRADAWSCVFLDGSTCAMCEGFKLCMGRFRPQRGGTDKCSAFFSEMIEVLVEASSQKEKSARETVWRS